MSVGTIENEADLRRFVLGVLEEPSLAATQAAQVRADLDQAISDILGLTTGGTTPTGPVGGTDITGTYPNALVIAAGAVTNSKIAAGAGIDMSKIAGLLSAIAGLQPLSSTLTALAAVSTDSWGRNLLALTGQANARLYLGLGTSSVLDVASSGNASSGQVVKGDDTRLTNARTPSAHASSHASAGSDPLTLAQSQITNLTTDLAAKAPLASPTFTGDPKAPTPAASDNDTSIATTAHVKAQKVTDLTAPTSSFSMNSQKITSLATGTAGTDGVNVGQMEVAILEAAAGYTRLPDVDYVAVSQWYDGPWIEALIGTRSGNVITCVDPMPLRIADYPLAGPLGTAGNSLGYLPNNGDTLLLVNQQGSGFGTGADNGIYTVTDKGSVSTRWVLTRHPDYDTTGDLVHNALVRGKSNGTQYFLSTADPITINSTVQTWERYEFYPSEHAASHAPSGEDPITSLPYGVLGVHTLTTAFSTSGTHTTMQDEGLTKSITYEANRRFRITLKVNPYANGGANNVRYIVYRGATALCRFQMRPSGTEIETATWVAYVDGPSSGATETFKVQVAAAPTNTQVTSYADANFTRQLIIEDAGPV